MKKIIDKNKFGPWAIITGASSGIGKEFARQLAADGLNVVLVARRLPLLDEVGKSLAKEFGIQYRTIEADLSQESAIEKITKATDDLDVGLLISNAGTGMVGKFFSIDEDEHKNLSQLNALSHLSMVYHFGKKMGVRKRGGILLTGAMGAIDGLPYMAVAAGTKGYIQSLGKSLNSELKEFGINVTVLVTTPTETEIFYKLGFTLKNTPVSPISVEQCVKESLVAISKNKMTVTPGLKFRIMTALVPGSLSREMTGKMLKKNNNIT